MLASLTQAECEDMSPCMATVAGPSVTCDELSQFIKLHEKNELTSAISKKYNW